MPDPTLSEAVKEAYASSPANVVAVHTLELRHPSFTEPIRVVLDKAPVEARLEAGAIENPGELVTFQPFSFSFKLPEVFDKGVPELEFSIDNVSGEIIDQIELAQGAADKLEVTYRTYLSTHLDEGPENDPTTTMTVVSIDVDLMTINAKATISDFANRKFPNNEYSETVYPGLIAS